MSIVEKMDFDVIRAIITEFNENKSNMDAIVESYKNCFLYINFLHNDIRKTIKLVEEIKIIIAEHHNFEIEDDESSSDSELEETKQLLMQNINEIRTKLEDDTNIKLKNKLDNNLDNEQPKAKAKAKAKSEKLTDEQPKPKVKAKAKAKSKPTNDNSDNEQFNSDSN